MQITPSPRILAMLGEIEIADWQCLAELVDNGIDEVRKRNSVTPLPEAQVEDLSRIEIQLPTRRTDTKDAEVLVRDYGRGMTQEQLQKAVRAGWSGNDPFEQLGLFGMGFNVATARLGRVTEILTTSAGEEQWRGVRIDLDKIGEDFEVPEIREQKDDPAVHGTKIRVRSLDPERSRNLAARTDAIAARLGEVYSWLLTNTPVTLRLNGKLIRAHEHCVWGKDRYVTYGSGRNHEQIPARIEINKELAPAHACTDCGHWQQVSHDRCDRCGSTALKVRERRIHGWVGIQRYLDSDHYGIDFIRNGRKVLVRDKSVFAWIDPNDGMTHYHEYPNELPSNKGRIVGEIHLDHVPVDYKKDRFETSSRDWIHAINFLRGEGPLRPKYARTAGYDVNDSPIGRLFRGYQRNDPGSKYLIPGDGKSAIHTSAAEWGALFHRGDSEYQTDQKWWDAVVYHDEEVQRRNAPEPVDAGASDDEALLLALGLPTGAGTMTATLTSDGADKTGDDATDGTARAGSDRPLTLAEQVDKLLATAKASSGLTREYRLHAISGHLDVQAWDVTTPILIGGAARPAPVYLHPTGGGSAILFIDLNHETFRTHGSEVLDLVLAEVAYFMAVRRNVLADWKLAQLISELRKDTFPDANLAFSTVQEQTRSVIDLIRTRLIEQADQNPQRAWKLLTGEEISRLETKYAAQGKVLSADSADFIENVSALYLVRLLEHWPDIFTDGHVFDDRYVELSSAESKQFVKSQLMSLLLDCATVAAEERDVSSLNVLKRARLSLEMLQEKITQG